MKKQKENSHEGITWSEMGKQNVQAEKVYSQIYESKIGLQAEVTTTPREGEFLRKKRLTNGYIAIALYAHAPRVRSLLIPSNFIVRRENPGIYSFSNFPYRCLCLAV